MRLLVSLCACAAVAGSLCAASSVASAVASNAHPSCARVGDLHGGVDLVTRYYDLSATTPELHFGEFQGVFAPYLLVRSDDHETPYVERSREPDSIAQLVLNAFGGEFEYEGRSLDIDERGRLRVIAPAVVQKDVAALLAFLESTFRRSVELRIDVLERPLGAPLLPALISQADAAKLIGESATARGATLTIGTGQVGALDASHNVSLVSEYDVEIAQAATQHNPIVCSFPIGLRLGVRAAALSGGVQLALTLQDGRQAGPIRDADIDLGGFISNEQGSREVSGRVTLQLISVLQRSMAMTLFIPDGQAAVIESGTGVQTGASRVAYVLRATSTSKDALGGLALPSVRARVDVFDASSLCPPRATNESELLDRSALPRHLSEAFSWMNGVPTCMLLLGDSSFVEERLSQSEVRGVSSQGPWMITHTAPTEPGAPEAPALSLSEVALSAPSTPEGVDVLFTLRRAGAMLVQWSGPLACGETSAFSLGGEQLAVTEADVEVAQSASTLDPITTSVYDGLLASIRPAHALDGGWVLELCVRAHVLSGPLQKVKMGAPLALIAERGEFDELISNERLSFAPKGGRPRAVIGMAGGLQLEIELR